MKFMAIQSGLHRDETLFGFRPKLGPDDVAWTRPEIFNEAFWWCTEQFGDRSGNVWSVNEAAYSFWFMDPVCAAAFKLRWC